MTNPFSASEIGATTVAGMTGAKAYQNGASALDSLNIALWWRWWYRNLTFSIFLFCIAALTTYRLYWVGPLQLVVNMFVFGVTYVSLIDISPGFKKRWVYRVFAPIQARVPHVARFWLYMLMFAPLWAAMWWAFFHDVKTYPAPR